MSFINIQFDSSPLHDSESSSAPASPISLARATHCCCGFFFYQCSEIM